MYGLTEAFRSTYLAARSVDEKPNSIGRAIPGAEVLVIDEQLQRCGPGQTGQLVHRGPTVALGYWDDPEATAQVFVASVDDSTSGSQFVNQRVTSSPQVADSRTVLVLRIAPEKEPRLMQRFPSARRISGP